MATILCTVDKSSWYEMYIEYSVSQDPITAVSTIYHALKLKQLTNGYDFAGTMSVTYQIGSESFSYGGMVNIDDVGNAGYTITIQSGTTTIQHDTSTGVGSFTVSCSGSCNAGGYGPGNISLGISTIALPTIDRAAPTISLTTSSITANSVIISATTNYEVADWAYSVDNGSSWVGLPQYSSYSTNTTITGLSPNTSYSIMVRGRRLYNNVYGSSTPNSITTLGNTFLNSVSVFTVDVASPVLTMNWTVFNNYTHTLSIKDGSTTVLTIYGLTGSTGTNNKSITLTSDQRTNILRHMANKASFNGTFELTTFDGDTQIGNASTQTALVQTTAETSAPTFVDFTHRDCDELIVGITNNDQIYVKDSSLILITLGEHCAKNEATLVSCVVTIGSTVLETKFDTTIDEMLTSDVAGENVALCVEVVDSRGYSTAVTKNITVIDYEAVSITDYLIRRTNEVEPTVELAFSGNLSPIVIDGESKNGIVSARFKYAPYGGSWSAWSDLAVVETNRGFEYATVALSDSKGVIEFDPNLQYRIQIEVVDRIVDDVVTLLLNKGTPLVAYRSKKVGINEPNPTAALHIRGEGDLLKLNDLTIQEVILNSTYPVGSIYMSVSATNPSELFGGEWEQIENRFLLACGSDYKAGSVGGESEHTLSVTEMPSHTHNDGTDGTRVFDVETNTGGGTSTVIFSDPQYGRATTATGGNQPHNNMPPYLAVYMWKRIN